MVSETGGAWVRFRLRIERASAVPGETPGKPSLRVSGVSSPIEYSGDGRLVISSYMVGVKANSGIPSDDIDSRQPDLNKALRSAVQAAAGRVWVAVLEEIAEEASPSRPGRPPGRVTGALIESIRIEIDGDGLGASIGSNLDYAAHLEFGTMDMPARPFLTPALERSKRVIVDIIEQAASAAVGVRGSAMAKRERGQGLGEFEAYKALAARKFQGSGQFFDNPRSPAFDALKELSKPSGKSEIYHTGVR